MSLYQILDNNELDYKSKVEQICAKLPQNLLVSWACDCAESVLYIYENKYPGDMRPREAIAAARSGDKKRSRAAAYAAYTAYAAAYTAANAAYAAAYTAANAAYAAYAAANAYVYAAAYAADVVHATNGLQQQDLNLQLLRKQVEIFESPLYKLLREV